MKLPTTDTVIASVSEYLYKCKFTHDFYDRALNFDAPTGSEYTTQFPPQNGFIRIMAGFNETTRVPLDFVEIQKYKVTKIVTTETKIEMVSDKVKEETNESPKETL